MVVTPIKIDAEIAIIDNDSLIVSPTEVTIVDNETIRQINNEQRDIDRPTDVLSFPMLASITYN